jgi:hypothetical protein
MICHQNAVAMFLTSVIMRGIHPPERPSLLNIFGGGENQVIMSLSKRRFCQHGRHPKIGISAS